MMKAFFSHRRTRFTVAVMLFVWLLAVGTGMANACLAQQAHARHGHFGHGDAGVAAMAAGERDHGAADHAAGPHPDAGDHDSAPGMAACQDFCEAGQTGVVKQSSAAPALADIAPMPAAPGWLSPPSAGSAARLPAAGDPGGMGPPLSIRFLRLTL